MIAKQRREPKLRTQRLTLRPLREDDIAALVAGLADYEVARMTARVPHPYGETDARSFLSGAHAGRGGVHLAVDRRGELIGMASLFALPRHPEIGFWIARWCWGRGFATEAAGAILDHGFGTLALPVVHYRVHIDNPASRRVAAKLGFRRVGFGVSRSLARGGEVEHIHAVLSNALFAPRHGP
jgi:RimJ/RimL family protein N-acetyltransferase